MSVMLGRDRAITRKEVRGILARSFLVERRKLVYPLFVETRDSYSYRDFLAHIGTPPQMDPAVEVLESANEPPAVDFAEFEQSWVNKLYKFKFWLSRAIMEMDQTGQVFTLLGSAAARLANFPDKLFFHRLQNATTTTYGASYTGSAFFSNSHNINGQTINNIVTGTLFLGGSWSNTNTDALAQRLLKDIQTVKARLLGFKDDRGEPFHQNYLEGEKLFILCGPLLEEPFRMALEADTIAQTTNTMKGAIKGIVTSNYLPSDPTDAEAFDWYVGYLGERNRPWIYSRFRQRTDKEIQDTLPVNSMKTIEGFGSTSMDDLRALSSVMLETNLGNQGNRAERDVIEHERFLIGGRWRGEILPGEPRNMVKVDNAGSS